VQMWAGHAASSSGSYEEQDGVSNAS
jgi:hypothetical protein